MKYEIKTNKTGDRERQSGEGGRGGRTFSCDDKNDYKKVSIYSKPYALHTAGREGHTVGRWYMRREYEVLSIRFGVWEWGLGVCTGGVEFARGEGQL